MPGPEIRTSRRSRLQESLKTAVHDGQNPYLFQIKPRLLKAHRPFSLGVAVSTRQRASVSTSFDNRKKAVERTVGTLIDCISRVLRIWPARGRPSQAEAVAKIPLNP